jgi:branched-chain amino acid transport system substrate-binding protein
MAIAASHHGTGFVARGASAPKATSLVDSAKVLFILLTGETKIRSVNQFGLATIRPRPRRRGTRVCVCACMRERVMISSGFKRTCIGAAFSVLALVCALPATAQDTIKIGSSFSMSGPYAPLGLGIANSIKLAFQEAGMMIDGHKVELTFLDDAGKPDIGINRIQELVERDNVDLLLAINGTAVGIAARDYIAKQQIPWVTLSSSAGLTRDKGAPNIFRVAPSNYQWAYGVAKWLRDTRGWKKVAWVGSDYASPREAFAAIKKVFPDGVAVDVWPPTGAPDYAPFLSHFDGVKANGTLVAVWGSDALKFLTQYDDYGLKKTLPLFGLASFASEEVLPGMPVAVEGVESAYLYCGTLDNPINKKFVAGYRALAGTDPGAYQYMAYVGALMTIQALKDVHGNARDRAGLLKALAQVHVDGPMGPVSFDAHHGMISDFYVMKVQKRDGKYENKCESRIAQVQDPYEVFP